MAVQYQVKRFQKDTSGTNGATQDVTFDFTPKAIIVESNGQTGDNTYETHYQWCQGFSDGTNFCCNVIRSEDGNDDVDSSVRTDSVFCRMSDTNTSILARASCSFGTNKVTFTWDVNNTAAYYITVIAIGGDDVTNVKSAVVDVGTTSTGTQDYTGLGFNPTDTDSILFTCHSSRTATNNVGGVCDSNLGVAISTTKRWVMGVDSFTIFGPSLTTTRYFSDTHCVVEVSAGTVNSLADFNGWITDGFQLDWEDAPSNSTTKLLYLVIKGGKWDVGSNTSPTSTGTQNYSVSVDSNTIRGLLTATTGVTTLATGFTHNDYGIGVSDGTNESVLTGIDEHGQDPPDSYRLHSADNKVIASSNLDGAILEAADFTSFGTNQYTVNWTNVDASARYFGWIVVADGAAVPAAEVAEEIPRHFGNPNTGLVNNVPQLGNTGVIFGY